MDAEKAERLHRFLLRVPEERVRRTLIDAEKFSVTDARLALKIARAGDAADFALHRERRDFPQIKLNGSEEQVRDQFWLRLEARLHELGWVEVEEPLPV